MKKLFTVLLLALIASCTIQENCGDCDKQFIRDTIVQTVYDTVVQRDTIFAPPKVDTLYVQVHDTVKIRTNCSLDTKHYDFDKFPLKCEEVTFDDIQIDSDKPYSIVNTYAGKGMYLKDGISFTFNDSIRLDYIYYKNVDCPDGFVYWDNGQAELPHRPKGEPVFLKIDQLTNGMYIDPRKKMILLGFGTTTLTCEE